MRRQVVFAPEAEEQLAGLYRYIAETASAGIAARYTETVVGYCESLEMFPHRGTQRDDIRPNLRITHYQSRTAIAFVVQSDRIDILGIFHGGREYAAALREPE